MVVRVGGGELYKVLSRGPPKKMFVIIGPPRLILMQSERSHQELYFLNIKKVRRKLECLGETLPLTTLTLI